MGIFEDAISKMGCALSDLASLKFSGTTPKQKLHKHGSIASKDMSDEHFSHEQKDLLRDTWEILTVNQQQHGEAIFQKIFSTKAETKQLFPFRDLEGEELLKNPLFRSHSRRFMHAIEHTIHHLDSLDLILVPVLHRLGERHVKIPGFKLDYLSIFIESMVHVFGEALGKKFTPEIRGAWQHLGKFIAGKMIEGYQSGLMSMGKYLASQCLDNVMITIAGNADKPVTSEGGDAQKSVTSEGGDAQKSVTSGGDAQKTVTSDGGDAQTSVTSGGSEQIPVTSPCACVESDNTGKVSCETDADASQSDADTCQPETETTHPMANGKTSSGMAIKTCEIDASVDQTDDCLNPTDELVSKTQSNCQMDDKSGKIEDKMNQENNHVQIGMAQAL